MEELQQQFNNISINNNNKRKRNCDITLKKDIDNFLLIKKYKYENTLIKNYYRKLLKNMHPDKNKNVDIQLFTIFIIHYRYLIA